MNQLRFRGMRYGIIKADCALGRTIRLENIYIRVQYSNAKAYAELMIE